MGVTHDEAICLRHREWSETSQTVVLLTKSHGLVRGLAKGSRREKSVFSGGFELLQLGEVGLIIKPDRELALLTEWDLTNPHHGLRADYRSAVLAMSATELIASALAPGDPHPGVFADLTTMLAGMTEQEADPAHLAAVCLASLLVETGQWPDLTLPAQPDKHDQDNPLGFDPVRGRVVSDLQNARITADPFSARTRHDAVWPIRPQTLRCLADLTDTNAPHAPRRVAERAARFLAAWLAYRTGRPPQSLGAFLRVTASSG